MKLYSPEQLRAATSGFLVSSGSVLNRQILVSLQAAQSYDQKVLLWKVCASLAWTTGPDLTSVSDECPLCVTWCSVWLPQCLCQQVLAGVYCYCCILGGIWRVREVSPSRQQCWSTGCSNADPEAFQVFSVFSSISTTLNGAEESVWRSLPSCPLQPLKD